MDRRMNFGRRPLILGTNAKNRIWWQLAPSSYFSGWGFSASAFCFWPINRICVISCIKDVLEVGYTAIFDLIQVTNEDMKTLQVTDLEWPEGFTLFTAPFAIGAMSIALWPRLSSAQKVFIGMIRYYKDEQPSWRHLWWPRLHFIVFIMRTDKLLIETTLMSQGSLAAFAWWSWIVNNLVQGRFSKSYGDLSEVIWEFLTKFWRKVEAVRNRFCYCLQICAITNTFLLTTLPADNTKILTWFAERNQDDSIDSYAALSATSGLVDCWPLRLLGATAAYPEEAKKPNTWAFLRYCVWFWEPAVNVSKSLRSSIRLTSTNWI